MRALAPVAPWGPQLVWMIALAYRKDFARAGEATLKDLELNRRSPMS